MLREVLITISNKKTKDTYLARSYPDKDFDDNGKKELYTTPVYEVYITGTDKDGNSVRKVWKALRFMPYWNDPKSPYKKYKTLGWVNAGLHKMVKKAVAYYDPAYGTQNTPSPYSGAIQLRNSFLIHAGPQSISNIGWGSAGCVEIIGNFNHFKNDIRDLSGASSSLTHSALLELVKARKLFVEVEKALPPNIKNNYYGEY